MNQIYFADAYEFQEKYEAGVINWWLIDEDGQDNDLFSELDRFDSFPSFNNLSFEDIMNKRFLKCKKSDNSLSFILKNDTYNENIINQNAACIRANNDKNYVNWEMNLSKTHEDSGDKTTCIDSIFKQESNILDNWDIQNQSNSFEEIVNHKEVIWSDQEESIVKEKTSSISHEFEEANEIEEVNSKILEAAKEINTDKIPFKRWGKNKDKLAFKMLQDIWKESSLDVEKFIKADESEIIDEYAQIFINELYSGIIEKIANEFGWVRRPIYLFHRFKKILSQASILSVREVKFLKQLLSNNSSQPIDYALIEFHFPCKSKSATLNIILYHKTTLILFDSFNYTIYIP